MYKVLVNFVCFDEKKVIVINGMYVCMFDVVDFCDCFVFYLYVVGFVGEYLMEWEMEVFIVVVLFV